MITFYEQWTIPSKHPFHSYLAALFCYIDFAFWFVPAVKFRVRFSLQCSSGGAENRTRAIQWFISGYVSHAIFLSSLVHDSITASVPMSAIYISFRKTITIMKKRSYWNRNVCLLCTECGDDMHISFDCADTSVCCCYYLIADSTSALQAVNICWAAKECTHTHT